MADNEKKCEECGHLKSEHESEQPITDRGVVKDTFRGECKHSPCTCPMFQG